MWWKTIVLTLFLAISAVSAIDDSSQNHTTEDEEEKILVSKKHLALEWLKSVSDSFWDLIVATKHPNFGGVQLLSPQNLWEKLHEKASHHFSGPSAAVVGVSHNGPSDYPFAYRNLRKNRAGQRDH